jgi:MraZ protein
MNLQFDSEGRISLSTKLLKHAKIKNSMLFVGQGKTFQIWEPTTFEKFRVAARKKSNINRSGLKWELQFNN